MFNYLKKSVHTISLCFTLSLAYLSTSPVQANEYLSGQECQPANLLQALNLGLGWNQQGTTNNSPIFTGSPFFVVCPISIDNNTDSTPTAFEIDITFLHPAAGNVACSFFEIDQPTGGSAVEAVQTVVAVNPGGGAYPRGVEVRNLDNGTFAFAGNQDYMSVVCALPPQTRIEGFTFEGS